MQFLLPLEVLALFPLQNFLTFLSILTFFSLFRIFFALFNTLIAVKITQNVKNTYVEVEAISKLRHNNVLKIFDCKTSADGKLIYVYLELCRGGELFNKIVANPEGKLSRRQAHRYCGQLLTALSYCHSRGIAHRDIKPENLLLGDDDQLKIADFGLAYLLGKQRETETWNLAQSKCGTALYAAPEIWKENEFCDIAG